MNSLEQQIINVDKNLQKDVSNLEKNLLKEIQSNNALLLEKLGIGNRMLIIMAVGLPIIISIVMFLISKFYIR